MAELERGVVKWFNDAKGFGFIEHSSGRDVFVHYSVIEWDGFKTLKDGEEVDYELCEGDKGLHAAKVVRVAAKKKRESDLAKQLGSEEELIAPHLESGSVSATVRTSASLIEVERAETDSSSDAAVLQEAAGVQSLSSAD